MGVSDEINTGKEVRLWHTNPIVSPFSSVNLLFSGGSMDHVFLSQIQVV